MFAFSFRHLRGFNIAKIIKTVLIVCSYCCLYIVLKETIIPYNYKISFIPNEAKIGSKYAFVLLASANKTRFSNLEGARVFSSRKCGMCFLTPSKAFVPVQEFDGVLLYRSKIEPLNDVFNHKFEDEKVFVLNSSAECYADKLLRCAVEPKVVNGDGAEFDLCGFCEVLLDRRKGLVAMP